MNLLAVLLVLAPLTCRAEVLLQLQGTTTRSFDSVAAGFGPRLPSEGLTGQLFVADPTDACTTIVSPPSNRTSSVALVRRGPSPTCDFGVKVLVAQQAGFSAVIVYDSSNEHLITMESTQHVDIPSVFVSEASGQELLAHQAAIVTLRGDATRSWSTLVMSFIVLAVTTITSFTVAMLFWYNRRRYAPLAELERVLGPENPAASQGATSRQIRRLPGLRYVQWRPDAKGEQCCICLSVFQDNDRILVLPCSHGFHHQCVGQWLRQQRRCPLCNRDPFSTDPAEQAEPTERTPLLNETQGDRQPAIAAAEGSSTALATRQSPAALPTGDL